MTDPDGRRTLPRTGSGIIRVVCARVLMSRVDDVDRFCAWAREVAEVEGAHGWVAPMGTGVSCWFEGSNHVVDAMVAWSSSLNASGEDDPQVTWGRPRPCTNFDVLPAPPSE